MNAFDEMEWKYNCDDLEERCIFRAAVHLDEDSKLSKIMFIIEAHEDSMLFLSTCDIKADIKNINRVAEYICRANWGLINGNFEFNYDNGNIRYKIFIDTEYRNISKEEFLVSIIISTEMWIKYGNGLVEILGSDKAIDDIIKSIENVVDE